MTTFGGFGDRDADRLHRGFNAMRPQRPSRPGAGATRKRSALASLGNAVGIGQPQAHILVACMPKSGSSFLSDVIERLPGFRRVQLIPDYDRREHELDEFCLQEVDRHTYVAQHHVRYSHWTAEMCRDYALAPVVLVRSMLDVAVSLRDALRKDGPVWPFFFAEPHHVALGDADLEEMIAHLALPWYVNFYMGWRQAPDALMIEYEDLTADPVRVVGQVLAFSGVHIPNEDIEAAVREVRSLAESRFNVGQVGRGGALRPELVRNVLQMVDFYPEAASDRYIQTLKAQGEAALSGQAANARPAALPPPPPTAFTPVQRWWRKYAPRVLMRGLAPLALVAVAVLYWAWPNDLLPDAGPYGRLDDLSFLAAACVLAGRLTLYRPRGHRLRRS